MSIRVFNTKMKFSKIKDEILFIRAFNLVTSNSSSSSIDPLKLSESSSSSCLLLLGKTSNNSVIVEKGT